MSKHLGTDLPSRVSRCSDYNFSLWWIRNRLLKQKYPPHFQSVFWSLVFETDNFIHEADLMTNDWKHLWLLTVRYTSLKLRILMFVFSHFIAQEPCFNGTHLECVYSRQLALWGMVTYLFWLIKFFWGLLCVPLNSHPFNHTVLERVYFVHRLFQWCQFGLTWVQGVVFIRCRPNRMD